MNLKLRWALAFALVVSALGSTSFAALGAKPNFKSFQLKYVDFDTDQVIFTRQVEAPSFEEAIENSSRECFKTLRAKNMDGISVIDTCANPRS